MKRLLAALLLCTATAAGAEQVRRADGYEIHYNAFRADFLPPAVSAQHGLTRAADRGLLNVTVLRARSDGTLEAIEADVRAQVAQDRATTTEVRLRPMYHRAAFIAAGIPIFEMRENFGMTDMLIRNGAHGAALARSLADRPAVLMRGHGATVVAPSLPRLVSRAIFLALNATLQMQARLLAGDSGQITFLDPEEARLIEAREGYGLGRAWEAWKRKALRPGR